tara:strand:- start:58 stop:273 length:216 start_codon:yes stop_codon:yes gene_type:complete
MCYCNPNKKMSPETCGSARCYIAAPYADKDQVYNLIDQRLTSIIYHKENMDQQVTAYVKEIRELLEWKNSE